MLGPQWLCGCNKSGGADTVEVAGADAAQHFLYHHDRGDAESVSVYKERNEWLYSISSMEQATEAIGRENATGEKVTFGAPFSLPAGATVEMKDSSGTSMYTVLSSAASALGEMTHAVQKAEVSTHRFGNEWKKPVDIEPLPPVARPARPMRGVDIGNMSFEEATATFSKMVDEQRRMALASWNDLRRRSSSTNDALRGY